MNILLETFRLSVIQISNAFKVIRNLEKIRVFRVLLMIVIRCLVTNVYVLVCSMSICVYRVN